MFQMERTACAEALWEHVGRSLAHMRNWNKPGWLETREGERGDKAERYAGAGLCKALETMLKVLDFILKAMGRY